MIVFVWTFCIVKIIRVGGWVGGCVDKLCRLWYSYNLFGVEMPKGSGSKSWLMRHVWWIQISNRFRFLELLHCSNFSRTWNLECLTYSRAMRLTGWQRKTSDFYLTEWVTSTHSHLSASLLSMTRLAIVSLIKSVVLKYWWKRRCDNLALRRE